MLRGWCNIGFGVLGWNVWVLRCCGFVLLAWGCLVSVLLCWVCFGFGWCAFSCAGCLGVYVLLIWWLSIVDDLLGLS